jgi:ribosomal protein L40E
MAICVKCEAILGMHRKLHPHGDLVLIEANGTSAYLPERYLCRVCGATLERDMRPDAIWRRVP